MIKICYVIGQLSMDGTERQLYELVRGIDKKRYYPIVISLSQGGYWADEIRKLNIQVIEILRRKNKEFARLAKLIKLFKTIKPDIVHTFLFSANSYGRIAAILCRAPVIIASERSLPEIGEGKSKFQIYIDKLLALFSHGIICNTQKASEILVKKYSFNAKKVFTVYNGIDVSAFMTKGNNNKSKQNKISSKVVGTVGRLDPVKNHKLFLDVAKIILDSSKNNEVKFLIIGDGPLKRDLEEYAQKLGIADNVIFTGERTDIPALLKSMDVFVLTSYYEGMSNSIMEAMSAGLPVVATDVGGNSELVINGKTGFLCPLGDTYKLAERIIYLITNENEAKQIGENGEKRMTDDFGVERMVKQTELIYSKILGQKKILSNNISCNA
ncbi:MAG: glycosyltransferase [Thermodesulfovibrionales bacterium]